MKPNRKNLFLAASISLALSAPAAFAQTTRYWDGNDNAANFGSASGTWAAPTTGTATAG